MVYRAVERLEHLGLITSAGRQPSSLGPARCVSLTSSSSDAGSGAGLAKAPAR
jgi:hypothetical protein